MVVKGDSADAIAAAVPMRFVGLSRKQQPKVTTPKRKQKDSQPLPTTPKRHTASTAKSPKVALTPRSKKASKPRTPKRDFEDINPNTTPKRQNTSSQIIEAFSTPKQDAGIKKEKMFASPEAKQRFEDDSRKWCEEFNAHIAEIDEIEL
eukprot:TRINITY_DN15074_c2_g1_i1.p1 TRINITY_DN15074_c2_g1~~TRINITY_DN15074_c2_g1_i1.p1  ORF type:complete len:149 (+),score=35.77 TRINITY_DN15074_c2_g1_i1:44-490(+)